MAKLNLKLQKTKHVNPSTKQKGYVARVITNGTVGFDEIAAGACENTTLHMFEAKLAFGLCMEEVAKRLKQGCIVDLGPVGKLYPSCQSGWFETAEQLNLSSVKPSLYFRAADEVTAAIKGATLQWVKTEDEE